MIESQGHSMAPLAPKERKAGQRENEIWPAPGAPMRWCWVDPASPKCFTGPGET
jgi:hypothetical protein